MTFAGGYKVIKNGTKWIGTDGWVWVNRGGKTLLGKFRKVKLYESPGHQRNFLDCVKFRHAFDASSIT